MTAWQGRLSLLVGLSLGPLCYALWPDRFWMLDSLSPMLLFGIGVAFGLLFLPASLFSGRWMQFLQHKLQGPGFMLAAVGISLVILFFLLAFPLRLILPPPEGMGDSLLLLVNVPLHSELFGYLDSFDELLELYIHSKIYLWSSSYLGWSVQTGFAFSSYVAFGLLTALAIYILRGKKLYEALLWLGLVGMNVRLALFAGYIENYTFSSVYLLALLWLGAEFLRDNVGQKDLELAANSTAARDDFKKARNQVFLLGALAAWGVLHHIIVAFVGPALIYFVWARARGRLVVAIQLAIYAGLAAAPMLAIIWSYFFIAHPYPISLLDAHVAHPPYLKPGDWFKPDHLIAMLNLVLLSMPLALPAIFWIIKSVIVQADHDSAPLRLPVRIPTFLQNALHKSIKWLAPRPLDRYVGLAALIYLLEMFLHRAQIGFPADWDLFSFASLPVNLYIFYRLLHTLEKQEAAGRALEFINFIKQIIPAILVFSLVWSAVFIVRLSHAHPDSALFLGHASRVATGVLEYMYADEIWHSDLPARRRRAYVQAYQFILDSEYKLNQIARLQEQEVRQGNQSDLDALRITRELQSQLQSGKKELRMILKNKPLLDSEAGLAVHDFGNRYKAWQHRMGPLNARIQKLVKSFGARALAKGY